LDSLHGNISTFLTLCSGASTESKNIKGLSTCSPLNLCATHDLDDYQNVLFANDATSQFIGFGVTTSQTLPTENNKGQSIVNQGGTITDKNSKICIQYTPSEDLKGECIFLNLCWLYRVEYQDEICIETVIATFKLCFDAPIIDNLTITNEDGRELEEKICTTEDDIIKITPDLADCEGYKITPYVSIDNGSYFNASSLIFAQGGTNTALCYQSISNQVSQGLIAAICSGMSTPTNLTGIDITTIGGTQTINQAITDFNQILGLLNTNGTATFTCDNGVLFADGEIISIELLGADGDAIINFTECPEDPLCYVIFKERLQPDREYCIKFNYTPLVIDTGNTIECDDLKVNITVTQDLVNNSQQLLLVDYGFSSIAQSDIVNASISSGTNVYNLIVSGSFNHVQLLGLNTFDGIIQVLLENGCYYEQVFSIPVGSTQTLVIDGV